jgi:hypothetical protein
MPRRRSRGTRYLDQDREIKALRPRLGLDNVARSTSDAPHNRRKPGLLSTGTPELAGNLAGINAKVPDAEFTKAKVSGAGTWTKGEVSGSGQWGKGELPGDVQYGRPNSANGIDWRDKSVPKRAIDAVDWGQVDNKPAIVTPNETRKFLTKSEADRLYRKK